MVIETQSLGTQKEEKNEMNQLVVKLSDALMKKLQSTALKENISVDTLVSELLGEGLVIRAWELIPKRSFMGESSQDYHGSYSSQNSQGRAKPPYNRGGHPNSVNKGPKFSNGQGFSPNKDNKKRNYKDIMSNNANFIEYVRSQEKRNK